MARKELYAAQELSENKFKKVQEQLTAALTHFQENPDAILEYLQFKSKFHNYSARNSILLQSQNSDAEFVAGFNRWKELNYNVRKGEKGLSILLPVSVTCFNLEYNNQKITKQISKATQEEKESIARGEISTYKKTYFKAGYVFDITQTDCPVEDYPRIIGMGIRSDQHARLVEIMMQFAEKHGFAVAEVEMHSLYLRGQYAPANEEIQLNNRLQDTQRLATLCHEISHGILHGTDSKIPRCVAEFEADGVTIMLHKFFNIDLPQTTQEHFRITTGECNRLDKFEVETSIEKIGKTFSAIREEISTDFSLLENAKGKRDFSKQIDDYLHGKLAKINALKVCDTPPHLLALGLNQLPMLISQAHLGQIIHPKGTGNSHWHGLTVEQVKKLPVLLTDPAMIAKSMTKSNSIIVVTDMLDADHLPVIISIAPNGCGTYELERLVSNFITSVYGKDHFLILDKQGQLSKKCFLSLLQERNAFLYIDRKRSQDLMEKLQLQLLHYTSNPDFFSIISQLSQKCNPSKKFFEAHTSDQISLEELKKLPITKIAEDMGFTLTKPAQGKCSLKEHDSVMLYLDSNSFYRFSVGMGGSVIDFVSHFSDCTTREAIGYLRENYSRNSHIPTALADIPKRNSPVFTLPQRETGKFSRLFAYLHKSRCIDSDILSDCINRKLIYEDMNHNVVFVGYNEQGTPEFAAKRSTVTGSSFRCDVAGSNDKGCCRTGYVGKKRHI